ncbi:cytochrome c oxidase subunit II [Falsiroseomonas sp. HC035]|uniref:cytochrome c oxidase subunit II n=1 Tax=Falsiroseomonas sp. HC035 TaxID=3390999 RepID=UPI003D317F3D
MRRVLRTVAGPALLLLAAACGGGPQSALDPAGDQAGHLHGLFKLMLWVCGGTYLLMLGFLGWSIWRSLHNQGVGREASAAGLDRGLRAGLGLWAGIVVIGLATLAAASFLVDRALASARADREAIAIRVTAHQWWWRIEYRNPATGALIETANELHLPADRTARIELHAADVIHSFWLPNLGGKLDVIPGRVNLLDITPRRIGWYRGQCAEFCGLQHALMALDLRVAPEEEFAGWLAAQAAPAAAPDDAMLARGRAVLEGGSCAVCHTVRGTAAAGKAGPDLTHVGSRRSIAAGWLPNNRGNLHGWILNPDALKPGTSMPAAELAPEDADVLARYLEWLR